LQWNHWTTIRGSTSRTSTKNPRNYRNPSANQADTAKTFRTKKLSDEELAQIPHFEQWAKFCKNNKEIGKNAQYAKGLLPQIKALVDKNTAERNHLIELASDIRQGLQLTYRQHCLNSGVRKLQHFQLLFTVTRIWQQLPNEPNSRKSQNEALAEYEKRFAIPRRSKADPTWDLRPEEEKEAFARWLEENTPTKITYTKAEAKAFWDQYGPEWEKEYFPRQQTPPSPSPQ